MLRSSNSGKGFPKKWPSRRGLERVWAKIGGRQNEIRTGFRERRGSVLICFDLL